MLLWTSTPKIIKIVSQLFKNVNQVIIDFWRINFSATELEFKEKQKLIDQKHEAYANAD